MAILYLLSPPSPTADETSLQKLAQFLGVHVRTISGPPDDENSQDNAVTIAATCQSLGKFERQPLGKAWLSRALANRGSSLFLTGITGATECVQTIATLLPGVVESVVPVAGQGSTYTIERAPATGMPQLAGLTFGRVNPHADSVFALFDFASGVTPLATVDGRPCYIKVERGGTSYFLLACAQVLDIDASVEPGQQPIDRFLHLVPFLGYLRFTFGALCWNNEAPAACLIIDDPLLKHRYGFLDFARLESHMDRSRYSLNIAFIPWNYRRTDRAVARRFKRPDRRFSVSVHGCDHSEAEFGVVDRRWLRSQSRRALTRMNVHEALTGIRHNRVMVFPQGVFSKASLHALDDEGFLAAVNSTICPVDAAADEITFRDHMEVALVRFGGVPLFLRHYPQRLETLALDIFLGRQILVVEHHSFFKRGYQEFEKLTDFVNKIAPEITWTDLEDLCTSACVMRELPDGIDVRTFGSVLRLRNRRERRTRFRISSPSAHSRLVTVTWNGGPIDFEVHRAGAVCNVCLDAGEEGILSFHRASAGTDAAELADSAVNRYKVFARRLLCELRDNYLDRSTVLSKLARHGKHLLPRL